MVEPWHGSPLEYGPGDDAVCPDGVKYIDNEEVDNECDVCGLPCGQADLHDECHRCSDCCRCETEDY